MKTPDPHMILPSKFHLGQVVSTPAVLEHFRENDLIPLEYITRHAAGDWGEVDAEDRAANDAAVRHKDRLLSAYTVEGRKFWIITEADRSTTTLLFPEEY
jgi:hypothetical protein